MYEYLDKRYALALYEVAEKENKVKEYIRDLKEIDEVIQGSKEITDVIKHPQISVQQKKKAFIEIFKGKVDEELLTFLLILIEKDRILFLKEKIKQMEKIHLERLNTLKGVVKTTYPLKEEDKLALIEKLKAKYNKDIILDEVIDPSIIGGIYLRIDNDVIDGTIKHKLDELKNIITRTE